MKKLAAVVALLLPVPLLADVAYIPREVLIDRADVIVAGKVTKTEDADNGQEYAVIEVKEVLKGDPKLKVVKQLQPALKGARLSHRVSVNVGEEGVFMLTRVQGQDAYRFNHPSAFVPFTAKNEAAVIADVRKIVKAREVVPTGKPVDGLAARVEVVKEGGVPVVRFALKNVSDKPVTVCDYVGQRPLSVKWVGPDGKEIESRHYDWLAAARLRPVAATNFVTITPGGVLPLGPGGPNGEFRLDNAPKGESKITISYTNRENGEAFGLKGVWTGTVNSAEVTFTK
jgi:hypothetical protein